MWNLFEQPWTLLGTAIIVLFGVLTFRSVWPEKVRWWVWLLPAGVATLGFALDRAVATDPEKINGAIRVGMRAVAAEDCVTIARLIAENYEDSLHKSKRALVDHCRARLVPPAVERVRKVSKAVEIAPPRATVVLTVAVKLEQESYWVRSYGKQGALVKVQFTLRKQPDKSWLITRVEVVEVDTMPFNWGMVKAPESLQTAWLAA